MQRTLLPWVRSTRRRSGDFSRRRGAKLRSKTKAQARKLGKKTGNYLKSIKRGKVYKYQGDKAVRCLLRPPTPT